MIFKILFSYICGYVNISVEGYFIERFINMCISKGILLWNIKRDKSTYLQTNISIRDFKKIKYVVKKTKCKVCIKRKRGLPFLLNKYRKRKIFALTLLIILVAIISVSQFIWNIEVQGIERIDENELLESLKEKGIVVGVRKSEIDTNEIIRKIRLERDDIAWMSIDLSGTNVIIKVVENTEKPEIIDEDEYCNIVSNKAGVITKISAKSGTALVKEGDVVKEGMTLVGGWMEGKYTGMRYVHSDAEIEARVWYEASQTLMYEEEENIYTNNVEKKYYIKINNFRINLYKTLPNFEKYDTISTGKKIQIFPDFYLPIELGIDEYQEIETKKVAYNRDELRNLIIENLESQLSEEIEDEEKIVNKQLNEKDIEGGLKIQLIYEVLENIGVEQKIEEYVE